MKVHEKKRRERKKEKDLVSIEKNI